VLLPILKAGLPANRSPVVIGEDSVRPAGYSGVLELRQAEGIPEGEILTVEAWDQS
jgi:hypothetical protein